jgi:hypothetical protein
MNPDLESLVKAFDAAQSGSPSESSQLFDAYDLQLQEVAARLRIEIQTLNRLVKWQHRQWRKAEHRSSSMPPKA